MKTRNKTKSILSALLAAVFLLGSVPQVTFAAQSSEYTDPADNWLKANGRTNELDANATTTYETGYCTVCERDTLGLLNRVPGVRVSLPLPDIRPEGLDTQGFPDFLFFPKKCF